MRISRLILSGAAIGTIIGTGRADLNATHLFNPAWRRTPGSIMPLGAELSPDPSSLPSGCCGGPARRQENATRP